MLPNSQWQWKCARSETLTLVLLASHSITLRPEHVWRCVFDNIYTHEAKPLAAPKQVSLSGGKLSFRSSLFTYYHYLVGRFFFFWHCCCVFPTQWRFHWLFFLLLQICASGNETGDPTEPQHVTPTQTVGLIWCCGGINTKKCNMCICVTLHHHITARWPHICGKKFPQTLICTSLKAQRGGKTGECFQFQ